MKDEIKEILEYYQEDIDRYEKTNEELLQLGYSEKTIKSLNEECWQRYRNHKLLLDYITNLQEENEKLKNDKKKVLELIENDYFEDGSFENGYEVLNILKEGK